MCDIFRNTGAKAIWKDHEKLKNRNVRFQTEFDAKESEKTTLYICCDTNYEVYVNGNFAGFDQYHDFPDDKKYDELDITPFLKDGKNLLSVLGYSQGIDSANSLTGLPMVIFSAVSGDKCLVKSDESVKCDDVPEIRDGEGVEKITVERPFSVGYDLRKYDFWKEKFVSSQWQNAVVCDDSKIKYSKRPVEKIRLGDVLNGKIVSQGTFTICEGEDPSSQMQYSSMAFAERKNVLSDDGEKITLLADNVFWVADIGEETAGYFSFDIEAEEGSMIDISVGEHLIDLRVRACANGRNYAVRTVTGEGRQRLTIYSHRWAGRYLQVFAHKGVKKIYSAGLMKTWYPFKFNSTLDTKDRLFNKIYEVSKRTLDLCVHEHYEDCAQREQSLYGFDSRNQMLAGYYAFAEYDMARESLRLLSQTQTEDGLFEITAPSKEYFTMPIFTMAWISALREYMLFSGDTDFGREMFERAKRVMKFFELDEEKNLIKRPRAKRYWNFYEWTQNLGGWEEIGEVEEDALLNAFYSVILKDYKDICEWTGNNDEKMWADSVHNSIRSAYHSMFYNEEKKAYIAFTGADVEQYSQLTQAWALCGDLVPEAYQGIIRETLASDTLGEVSLSHSFFKYDALMKEPEKYTSHVLDDIEKLWGNMVYNNATTFWETALGDDDERMLRAGSYCHGWAAMPIYIFWKYMAGVYPEKPGFENITPNPVIDSNIVEGTIKTPSGIYSIKSGRGITEVTKL